METDDPISETNSKEEVDYSEMAAKSEMEVIDKRDLVKVCLEQDHIFIQTPIIDSSQQIVMMSAVNRNTKPMAHECHVMIRPAFSSVESELASEYIEVARQESCLFDIFSVPMGVWTLVPSVLPADTSLKPFLETPTGCLDYLKRTVKNEMEAFVARADEFMARKERVAAHGLEKEEEFHEFKRQSEEQQQKKSVVPTQFESKLSRGESRLMFTRTKKGKDLRHVSKITMENQKLALVSIITPVDYEVSKVVALKVHGILSSLEDPKRNLIMSHVRQNEPYLDCGVVDMYTWLRMPMDSTNQAQRVEYSNPFLQQMADTKQEEEKRAAFARTELQARSHAKPMPFYETAGQSVGPAATFVSDHVIQ